MGPNPYCRSLPLFNALAYVLAHARLTTLLALFAVLSSNTFSAVRKMFRSEVFIGAPAVLYIVAPLQIPVVNRPLVCVQDCSQPNVASRQQYFGQ